MPQQKGRPAVIGDVARLAGVSVPTVSRVLNGVVPVSEDKRLRVQAAIEELHYRPNGTARALVSRSPSMIAVLAGDTSKYGYAETIRGVEEAARQAGYLVGITVVESTDEAEIRRTVDFVLRQPIAGVVVLKFDPEGVAALAALPASIPAVVLSGARERGARPQAALEEATAAGALVQHLLDLGHRTVEHVSVPASAAGREDERTLGWRAALEAAGAPVPEVLEASWDPRSGYDIGRGLRTSATAVFCGNDEIAMGVIRGLHDAGRSVPADVSVVGFDDHPLASLFIPALTSAHQDFAGMGARGFEQLRDLLDGREAPAYTDSVPTVVVRESSGPPRV